MGSEVEERFQNMTVTQLMEWLTERNVFFPKRKLAKEFYVKCAVQEALRGPPAAPSSPAPSPADIKVVKPVHTSPVASPPKLRPREAAALQSPARLRPDMAGTSSGAMESPMQSPKRGRGRPRKNFSPPPSRPLSPPPPKPQMTSPVRTRKSPRRASLVLHPQTPPPVALESKIPQAAALEDWFASHKEHVPVQAAPGFAEPTHTRVKHEVTPAQPASREAAELRVRTSKSSEQVKVLSRRLFLLAAAIAGLVLALGITPLAWPAAKTFCDTGHVPEPGEGCTPCPTNGVCQNGELRCAPGFVRRRDACVPDHKFEEKVQRTADLIVDHVCSSRARALCNLPGGQDSIPEMALRSLFRGADFKHTDTTTAEKPIDLETLDSPSPISTDPQELEVALQRAADALKVAGSVPGDWVFFCPDEVVGGYKPLGCRLRGWAWQHWGWLLLGGLALLALVRVWWKQRQRRALLHEAEELYSQVCKLLEEAHAAHSGEKWVPGGNLRDTLLPPRRRGERALWAEVERLVKEDSRIEVRPQLVRGEQRTVWEWIEEGAPLSPTFKSLRQRASAAIAGPQNSSTPSKVST